MRGRALPLMLVAVAIGGAALGFVAGGWIERAPPRAPFDQIVRPDLGGAARTLADFRGRRTLVNLWATWCAPCVAEMPLLDALAERGEVAVVGVALDDPDTVRAFVTRHGIDYPILLDAPGRGSLSTALGNTRGALPYTVLLDERGAILRHHVGALDERSLATFLR